MITLSGSAQREAIAPGRRLVRWIRYILGAVCLGAAAWWAAGAWRSRRRPPLAWGTDALGHRLRLRVTPLSADERRTALGVERATMASAQIVG